MQPRVVKIDRELFPALTQRDHLAACCNGAENALRNPSFALEKAMDFGWSPVNELKRNSIEKTNGTFFTVPLSVSVFKLLLIEFHAVTDVHGFQRVHDHAGRCPRGSS